LTLENGLPKLGSVTQLVVIDNYDSFTYNLVQYLRVLEADVDVFLHDAITIEELRERSPDGILLSPGPCTPDEAGICLDVVQELGTSFPIFGVCLGHQTIGQAFGGSIVRADRLMHGKTSPIHHDNTGVFHQLPNPMIATRYHSLVIQPASLPSCLRKTAWTEEGEIMGVCHESLPIHGVQFHPESFLTEVGLDLLRNWLQMVAPSS
jgi:anthranilate synthase/aminodeoxychorismate synthase-like glutamine amidotransferase